MKNRTASVKVNRVYHRVSDISCCDYLCGSAFFDSPVQLKSLAVSFCDPWMRYHIKETFPLTPKCFYRGLLWLFQGAIHSAEAPLLWNVFCWILLQEREWAKELHQMCMWYIVWSSRQYGTPVTEIAVRCFLLFFFFHIRKECSYL